MDRDKPAAKGQHRDPQTPEERPGTPLGTHPVGTAVGGVLGAAAAGAAVGTVAGPAGAVVGAAIGAAAGGLAGKLAVDLVDPKMEDEFWRKNWSDRKYIDGGFTYDQDWAPAYRYGVDRFRRDPQRRFEDVEPELAGGWEAARGTSRLEWERARPACRDAWQRADEIARGHPTASEMGDRSQGAAGSVHTAMEHHALRDSELPEGGRNR